MEAKLEPLIDTASGQQTRNHQSISVAALLSVVRELAESFRLNETTGCPRVLTPLNESPNAKARGTALIDTPESSSSPTLLSNNRAEADLGAYGIFTICC